MDIQAAETLARQKVVALWPELAGVTPVVAPRQRFVPSPELLARLNLAQEPRCPAADGDEYTFTFAAELSTPEGQSFPKVARVTVNTRSGVVKACVSK